MPSDEFSLRTSRGGDGAQKRAEYPSRMMDGPEPMLACFGRTGASWTTGATRNITCFLSLSSPACYTSGHQEIDVVTLWQSKRYTELRGRETILIWRLSIKAPVNFFFFFSYSGVYIASSLMPHIYSLLLSLPETSNLFRYN